MRAWVDFSSCLGRRERLPKALAHHSSPGVGTLPDTLAQARAGAAHAHGSPRGVGNAQSPSRSQFLLGQNGPIVRRTLTQLCSFCSIYITVRLCKRLTLLDPASPVARFLDDSFIHYFTPVNPDAIHIHALLRAASRPSGRMLRGVRTSTDDLAASSATCVPMSCDTCSLHTSGADPFAHGAVLRLTDRLSNPLSHKLRPQAFFRRCNAVQMPLACAHPTESRAASYTFISSTVNMLTAPLLGGLGHPCTA